MEGCSVIIPTYNRPDELKRAVNTVLSQDYKGQIEIIIVDDSNELSLDYYCKPTKVPNRSITYIHNNERKGAPHARNVGYSRVKYNFVAFLDDDDEWCESKITKQIALLKSVKTAPLCICHSHDKRFGVDRINAPPDIITHAMTIKSFNLSSTSSYMIKKQAADKIIKKNGFLFDESLKSGQEYDLAIRITKLGDAVCVPEVLITQNATPGQISQKPKKKISGIIQLCAKHHNEYEIIDYMKTIGLIGLFILGYLLGDKIYKIIIPIKERYEV